MRSLIINRKKQFVASLVAASILVDGVVVGKLKNGASLTLPLDEEAHKVEVKLNKLSEVVEIPSGSNDVTLNGMFNYDRFVITSTSGTVSNANPSEVVVTEVVAPTPKSLVPPIICGAVLVLVVTILAQVILQSGETSVIGAWTGVGISVLAAVSLVLGGFWFYIIPLPYIFIYKFGCNRPHIKLSTRVILGVASLVLFALSFAAMFILS